MALNQMRATLLRPVLALLAIAGLLTLAGCGGGSGAPNNPFAPGPVTPGALFVLPPSMTVYTGTPATLTISGGAPPYQAFSSNGTALPVTQAVNGSTVVLLPNNVAANTTAVITIQDNIGQTATSTITVSPAPILNTIDDHSSKNDVRHEYGMFRRYRDRCSSGYGTKRSRHSESSSQIRCRDWRVRDTDKQSSCAARPDVDGGDG